MGGEETTCHTLTAPSPGLRNALTVATFTKRKAWCLSLRLTGLESVGLSVPSAMYGAAVLACATLARKMSSVSKRSAWPKFFLLLQRGMPIGCLRARSSQELTSLRQDYDRAVEHGDPITLKPTDERTWQRWQP